MLDKEQEAFLKKTEEIKSRNESVKESGRKFDLKEEARKVKIVAEARPLVNSFLKDVTAYVKDTLAKTDDTFKVGPRPYSHGALEIKVGARWTVIISHIDPSVVIGTMNHLVAIQCYPSEQLRKLSANRNAVSDPSPILNQQYALILDGEGENWDWYTFTPQSNSVYGQKSAFGPVVTATEVGQACLRLLVEVGEKL